MHGGIDGTPYSCREHSKDEDDVVVVDGVVDDKPDGRSNAGGKVVGQPVIADALSPS